MASTNQSPEFLSAQKIYLAAQTDGERLTALEQMLKYVPKHKAGEAMRANLRTRYKKLKEKLQKQEKQKKKTGKKIGIKKEGTQVVLCGLTNSGKSSLLAQLTNATPEIASYEYTTKQPILGTLDHDGVKFQLIDMPAINHDTFDQSLANSADILIIVITSINQIQKIMPFLKKSQGKKIIAFNKSDLLSQEEKRKIEATLKSKKYEFCFISNTTRQGMNELKQKFLENSHVIRIYTKEPHNSTVDVRPVILPPESTVQDLADKIFHKKPEIKQIKITGPSSKFPNQQVGLSHVLKDKDVVEFNVK